MDIKILQQINADGLEQWMPVMKDSFPLPGGEVKKVFDAFKISPLTLTRAEYTLEQFIDELAKPGDRLRVVNVHKKRARYTVDGCMAELTDVTADGKSTRTVALELEDPAHVIATVRKIGLGQFQNVSYPRGLKQLVGMKS